MLITFAMFTYHPYYIKKKKINLHLQKFLFEPPPKQSYLWNYGLNVLVIIVGLMVSLQHLYVEVLTLSTSECDLIWK